VAVICVHSGKCLWHYGSGSDHEDFCHYQRSEEPAAFTNVPKKLVMSYLATHPRRGRFSEQGIS
jgi:hypothetical protein